MVIEPWSWFNLSVLPLLYPAKAAASICPSVVFFQKAFPNSGRDPDNGVVLTLADGGVASAKPDGPVIPRTFEPHVWENESTQLF
jgi:hypothetical protein